MTLGKEEEMGAGCCPRAALEGPPLRGCFWGSALCAEGRHPTPPGPGAPPFTAPTSSGMKLLTGAQMGHPCGSHSFPRDPHSHTAQGTWPGYLPVHFWPEPGAQSGPCERTRPQEGLTFLQNDLTYPSRLTVGPGRAQVPLGPCGWGVPAGSIQVAVVGGPPLPCQP